MNFKLNKIKTYTSLIFIGYISFFINAGEYLLINNPLILALSTILLFYIVYKDRKTKDNRIIYLIPFSSGIFSFFMKLFYVDKFDYANRLNNLILLSLIFSIIGIILKYKLYKTLFKKFNSYSLKKRIIIIFVITELVFIFSSFVLVEKGVVLVGDEPHYLAISHSIAKDHDINVFNQYARDEYRDFIDHKINSHAKEGKGFKKWYSIHLPGVSFTFAPFMLLKIPFPILYFLIRSFIGLFGAGIAVLIYLFLIRLLKKENLSIYLTFIFTFTAPVFFMSIHVFAEIQATFLILLSLYLLIIKKGGKRRKIELLLSGLFISLTVFWGLKYLLFIMFYLVGIFIYFIRKKKIKDILILSFFPIVSLILFSLFLLYAYGTISPTAIYTGVISKAEKAELIKNTSMIPLSLRIETLLDYFFDQRDGLLLYNPFYIFFFPGLILAFIKIKKYYLYILISCSGFIYILYHGYSTIRAGYCPQARYLTPVTWIFLIFALIYYIESENRIFKRIFLFLPLYSLAVSVFQLFNPFTLYQQTTHDSSIRAGLMFQKIGNMYINISDILPSFAKVEGNFKYLPNIIFILFLILFTFFALKKINMKHFYLIKYPIFIFIFIIVSLFPNLPLYNPIKVKSVKNNSVPFYLYGNKTPSGRIFQEGFGTIQGNGEFKIYLSIPKYFLVKKRNHLKTISGEITFINSKEPFKVDIYNYNIMKISKLIKKDLNNKLRFNNLSTKVINSKSYIVFTLLIKNNSNKKPIDFRLKLFSLNDRLKYKLNP